MHFGECNPLDVLATAATTLKNPGEAGSEGETSSAVEGDENDDDGSKHVLKNVKGPATASLTEPVTVTIPDPGQIHMGQGAQSRDTGQSGTAEISLDTGALSDVVKVVSEVNGKSVRPTTIVASTRATAKTDKELLSKSLTIVRVNKGLNPLDHSYAFCKSERPRPEEDEGYSSRSSLGSPGQSWKSDSEANEPDVFESNKDNDAEGKSPGATTRRLLPHGSASCTVTGSTRTAGKSLLRSDRVTQDRGDKAKPGHCAETKVEAESSCVGDQDSTQTVQCSCTEQNTSEVIRCLCSSSSETIAESQAGDKRERDLSDNSATDPEHREGRVVCDSDCVSDINPQDASPGVSTEKPQHMQAVGTVPASSNVSDSSPASSQSSSQSCMLLPALVSTNSSTVLHGLLSSGGNQRGLLSSRGNQLSRTTSLLVPGTGSGRGRRRGVTAKNRVTSSYGLGRNSAGTNVVYLLASTSAPSSGGSKTVPILATSMGKHGHQYIIQDDVPPVAKFQHKGIPAVSADALSKQTVTGSKENWLVLAARSPSTAVQMPFIQGQKVKTHSQEDMKSLIADNDSGTTKPDLSVLTSGTMSPLLSATPSAFTTHSTSLLNTAGADSLEDAHRERCGRVTPASGRTTPAPDGRLTPLIMTSPGSVETPHSPGTPNTGKINIKISGGVVVDVTKVEEPQENASKARTSIGHVGSLSWQGLTPAQTVTTMTGRGGLRRGRKRTSEGSVVTEVTDSIYTSMRGYGTKKRETPQRGLSPSQADLSRMKQSALGMSRLHPLIDHDYCMFSEFSAEIQSSIIATTETKQKTEKKYAKKTKSARGKTGRKRMMVTEKPLEKLKKRKYCKRKFKGLLPQGKSESDNVKLPLQESDSDQKLTGDGSEETVSGEPVELHRPHRESRRPKRKYRPRNNGEKNFVKIPGSYQDEFVYFATKRTRGRTRNSETGDNTPGGGVPNKPAPVAGINVFDWYKEMSKTDKGSKFGVNEEVTGAANSSTFLGGRTPVHESEVADLVIDMMPGDGLQVGCSTTVDTTSPVSSLPPLAEGSSDQTEQDNSVSDKGAIEPNSMDFNLVAEQLKSFFTSMADAELKDFHEKLSTPSTPVPAPSTPVPTPSSPVPAMSSSAPCEKAEVSLTELDPSLSSAASEDSSFTTVSRDTECSAEIETTSGVGETAPTVSQSGSSVCADGEPNLNAYLTSYGPQSGVSLSQGSSQLLDLDEINDSDLLQPTDSPSDISAILGDLERPVASSAPAVRPNSLTRPHQASLFGMEQTILDPSLKHSASGDSNLPTPQSVPGDVTTTSTTQPLSFNFGKPLDKTELFPDFGTASPQPSQVPTADLGAPELTVVNMYWNDLPGLLINGQEHVRLVDIHKQVLPSKDTGILKKRCQMMGLDILLCSEMQRDFLMRYMNAAKSKSCVIVSKEAAKTLIGFYVDPRPRVISRNTSEDQGKSYQLKDKHGQDTDSKQVLTGKQNVA